VTRRLRTSARADRQIAIALSWWSHHRDKAPEALFEELERAKELLIESPHIGRPVRRTRHRGARVITLDRVRYNLYYQVRGDTIVILALWHASRPPPRL
jgi:plasmid stabilization system protein ParE